MTFGSASGFGTAVNTGISSSALYLIGDVLGTGKDGFLVDVSGIWWYYTWNGTSFVGTDTGAAVSSDAATSYAVLYDVDGDGLPDIVTWQNPTSGTGEGLHVETQINTSSAGGVHFSATVNDAFDLNCSNCSALVYTPGYGQDSTNRTWDLNGDGRGDLLFYEQRIVNQEYTYLLVALISQGTTFTASTVASNFQNIASPGTPFVVDWNNDSCDDVIYNGSIYVSGCDGTSPAQIAITGNFIASLDWDGDGRTDLLVANGSTVGVYQSTGTGITGLISSSVPYSANCSYFVFKNGDGQDALGCWGQAVTYYTHNGTLKTDLATSFTDGFGNSASPTYVSMVQGDYTPYQYASPSYPYANYLAPLYLVNKATFSDPSTTTGTYYQTFSYSGAWINLQGRGFSNFLEIQKYDSRNELWETDFRSNNFPWADILAGVTVSQDQAQTKQISSWFINDETYITLDGTANNERYFPYYGTKTTNNYELGGSENGDLITTTNTTWMYDNYGNATSISTTVTDNDPNSPYTGDTWTVDITNTPEVDTTHWCLGLFTQTQVAYSTTPASLGAAVTRTKAFTPDTTNCRYTQMVTEPTANNGLYKVTEALTFDSFGNVATDTVTGANMPSSPASREMQLNWGTTGQFLNTLTDPSGAVTTWAYTSNQALTFGVPDSKKDPNSLTTSWAYDAFGRKTKETRPDGTSTGWAWSLCTSYCSWSNSVYQIAQTAYQTNGTTVIRTDTSSYDPIDRVTQTVGPTVTGTMANVQRIYNSLGLLTQQSIPFLSGATAYQQTFAYDALNRPISISRPISSTNSTAQSTTYSYAGRTTVVKDPYGNPKTMVTDVNGQLRKTTDAIGTGYTITRALDAAGTLTGITDSLGNTLLSGVTVVYGIKPFRTAATDADRGAWSYTIDSLGERTSWTDAKGQSFSMTYDALSRPLTRTEPDLFTEWNYGTAAPTIGQLTSECTAASSTTGPCTSGSWLYVENRTFDSYGRLSTRSITQNGNGGNDPGGVFLFTLGYNTTTGLLNTLTYPKSTAGTGDPLTLQYGYGYGLLQSVTDTGDTTVTCGNTCTLWTANAMNAFGQVTQETLGNGIVVNRTYDNVTSWLSAAIAGVGGGSAVLNQSYLRDEDGNLIQRQDNNLGLTESFAYDADSRLTCTALSSGCSTPTWVYDGGSAGPGNITSQTGVGTYTYPAAGQPHPHAVSSITGTFNGVTNPSFSYDANGNMTARASSGTNITWFSDNYPASISVTDATGSEEVQFSYGPDRQRWKQVYSGPNGTENTYYIGGLMDKVYTGITDYRHYIYAGSEPVAIYSRTGTNVVTMRYLLEDHQGGVSSITSNAGVTDVNESFSAFGQRRNTSTWSGPPPAADLNTIAGVSRQGYTFQTWLGQSMGLNHMNGRVQDAILGRFISADPYVPDPTNAQSYNRYAYVNNNPLTRVDPSGFWPNPDFQEDGGGDPDGLDDIVVTAMRIPTGDDGGPGPSSGLSVFSNPTIGGGGIYDGKTSTLTKGKPAQSQSGSTTVTGSGFGGTFPDGTTIGGDSEIIATSSASSMSSVDFMAAQNASIVWPAIFAGRAYQSAFNSAFNVLSNTTKLFTKVGNTIPDLYKSANGILELKNGAYIYNSAQINAQLAAAEAEGVPYYLGVSPTSTVAGTTSAAVEATGGEVFVFDAAAGTISSAEGGEVGVELLEFLALLGEE